MGCYGSSCSTTSTTSSQISTDSGLPKTMATYPTWPHQTTDILYIYIYIKNTIMIASMRRRCQAVIGANDGHIRYWHFAHPYVTHMPLYNVSDGLSEIRFRTYRAIPCPWCLYLRLLTARLPLVLLNSENQWVYIHCVCARAPINDTWVTQ